MVKSNRLIELKNIVKSYNTEAGELTVLKNINLHIDSGEFVGVIGKSGSGKSTLINMIAGIDRPTSGEVHAVGTPIHTLDEGKVAKWRGKNMGIVFQFFQLLPTLSVIENVMLPMDFLGAFSQSMRKKRAFDLLDQVDISDQAHKMPSQLSGGQQQRVAIARALANDPPIIVADEPTGNLDSKTSDNVVTLFEKLVKNGKTILMVTHDSDQAKRVGRTLIISDGEIIEEYLTKIFPTLSEKQFVWVTKKMKREKFKSGESIIEEGRKQNKLYIVTKGKVRIIIKPRGKEICVAEYEKGQFFGEIELMKDTPGSLASVRADSGGAEIATLEKQAFLKLLSDSKKLQEEFGKVASERLKENISKKRKS